MDLLKELSQVKLYLEDMFKINSVEYPNHFFLYNPNF